MSWALGPVSPNLVAPNFTVILLYLCIKNDKHIKYKYAYT